jgi:hypothetical protein
MCHSVPVDRKWKVAIVGPTGTVYKHTNAFKLLYPFPTQEEAEARAECLRSIGMKVSLCDEQKKHILAPGEGRSCIWLSALFWCSGNEETNDWILSKLWACYAYQ